MASPPPWKQALLIWFICLLPSWILRSLLKTAGVGLREKFFILSGNGFVTLVTKQDFLVIFTREMIREDLGDTYKVREHRQTR